MVVVVSNRGSGSPAVKTERVRDRSGQVIARARQKYLSSMSVFGAQLSLISITRAGVTSLQQGMPAVLCIGLFGCGKVHTPGLPEDGEAGQPSKTAVPKSASPVPQSGAATSPLTLVALLNHRFAKRARPKPLGTPRVLNRGAPARLGPAASLKVCVGTEKRARPLGDSDRGAPCSSRELMPAHGCLRNTFQDATWHTAATDRRPSTWSGSPTHSSNCAVCTRAAAGFTSATQSVAASKAKRRQHRGGRFRCKGAQISSLEVSEHACLHLESAAVGCGRAASRHGRSA
jgi:hypothetical protein